MYLRMDLRMDGLMLESGRVGETLDLPGYIPAAEAAGNNAGPFQ
jgi:hypothetical protein